MTIAAKTRDGLGVAYALKVIEEGMKPMSPQQIQGKYKLSFPFTVERIVQGRKEDISCPPLLFR